MLGSERCAASKWPRREVEEEERCEEVLGEAAGLAAGVER
jgi:hypothetical protein